MIQHCYTQILRNCLGKCDEMWWNAGPAADRSCVLRRLNPHPSSREHPAPRNARPCNQVQQHRDILSNTYPHYTLEPNHRQLHPLCLKNPFEFCTFTWSTPTGGGQRKSGISSILVLAKPQWLFEKHQDFNSWIDFKKRLGWSWTFRKRFEHESGQVHPGSVPSGVVSSVVATPWPEGGAADCPRNFRWTTVEVTRNAYSSWQSSHNQIRAVIIGCSQEWMAFTSPNLQNNE